MNDGLGEEVHGTVVVLGGGLEELGLQVGCELLPGCLRDDSVEVEISLVADYHQGKGGVPQQVHQLLVDGLDHLEALLVVDGVDEDVAVNVDGVLSGEDAVLVLPGSVHHQHLVLLAEDLHVLVEGVLDGRVVGVNKLSLSELNSKAGLSHRATSHHRDLSLLGRHFWFV